MPSKLKGFTIITDSAEDDLQAAIEQGGTVSKMDTKSCYAMLEGGMIFTREEKWKKMKVARFFDKQDHVNISKDRMRYKTYREKDLVIGSGPIEAAHRNVIQQRMKLSSQKWNKMGAQQMANLRVLNKSNQWRKLNNFIEKAA